MWSSFSCASLTVLGASTIRSMALAVLGNAMTSRRLGAGEDHDDAVEAQCNAAMRRRAVLQRFEEEAKASSPLRRDMPSARKISRLHVLPMNTDGARAELHAIQHDVVGEGAHGTRVGVMRPVIRSSSCGEVKG